MRNTPVQAPTDRINATHIMEVTGGAAGQAFVGCLTDSSPRGYALYLRQFSITNGWRTRPRRVSNLYGNRAVWPGDTFGLSTLGPNRIVTSWGSAAPNRSTVSMIYSAEETTALGGAAVLRDGLNSRPHRVVHRG